MKVGAVDNWNLGPPLLDSVKTYQSRVPRVARDYLPRLWMFITELHQKMSGHLLETWENGGLKQKTCCQNQTHSRPKKKRHPTLSPRIQFGNRWKETRVRPSRVGVTASLDPPTKVTVLIGGTTNTSTCDWGWDTRDSTVASPYRLSASRIPLRFAIVLFNASMTIPLSKDDFSRQFFMYWCKTRVPIWSITGSKIFQMVFKALVDSFS